MLLARLLQLLLGSQVGGVAAGLLPEKEKSSMNQVFFIQGNDVILIAMH